MTVTRSATDVEQTVMLWVRERTVLWGFTKMVGMRQKLRKRPNRGKNYDYSFNEVEISITAGMKKKLQKWP